MYGESLFLPSQTPLLKKMTKQANRENQPSPWNKIYTASNKEVPFHLKSRSLSDPEELALSHSETVLLLLLFCSKV